MLLENKIRCTPPLDETEVRGIVESASKSKNNDSKSISEVLKISGIEELLEDSSGDQIAEALKKTGRLAMHLSKEDLVILKGTVHKKLKTIKFPSPAQIVKEIFHSKSGEDEATPGFLEDPIPWDDEVNGAVLVDEIKATLLEYVYMSEEAAEAVGLWILHAWVLDAFQLSPILRIKSPTKGCGKTTLLTLAGSLLPRSIQTGNITTAAIFRLVDKYQVSLCLDEADVSLRNNEEITSLLNSGYTRSTALVPRCDGENNEVKVFSSWAPKMIAGIGNMAPTTEDRSIQILLKKKQKGEIKARFRFDKIHLFNPIREKLLRWSQDNVTLLKEADPDIPRELGDRPSDNWRPLIGIADLIGDHWPETTRKAALKLNNSVEDEDLGIQLIEDIHYVIQKEIKDCWDEEKTVPDRISTMDLCAGLNSIEESPWESMGKVINGHSEGINGHRLSRLLRHFGTKPKNIRFDGDSVARGYEFKQFEDVFSRYLGEEVLQVLHD